MKSKIFLYLFLSIFNIAILAHEKEAQQITEGFFNTLKTQLTRSARETQDPLSQSCIYDLINFFKKQKEIFTQNKPQENKKND